MDKKFRLNNSLPKIGIRPVIDGREEGIRETLESQTMRMAENAAKLISSSLRHASGEPVECVVSNSTIGGVAEAALCEEQFKKEGIDITLTVTPCWCYGTETIDMNRDRIKAIWGFNGTERPGAVYLAAAIAGHDQLGLPVFGIYGKDVQDQNDETIPEDVKEKIIDFCKAAIAVKTMKDTSYLSVGSVSMGIVGSVIDPNFFSDYLGMRNEYVDMSEVDRRIKHNIFDPVEYRKALAWVKENCNEGPDYNDKKNQFARVELDEQWEFVVKMTLIFRDLMIGNPRLKELGYKEEARGHNALIGGFQGQRQWTDYQPNGDFLETILNSSFDWNGIREAYVVATENDSLNGVSMLFGHLLTGTAQIFSDVRTYWSFDAVKRTTGHEMTGKAQNGILHLINSGSTTIDGTGEQQDKVGNPSMKPYWDITDEERKKMLEATEFCPANNSYFRGGGFSTKFYSQGEMPITMSRINIIKGLGPVLQIAEGYSVRLPEEVHEKINLRTDPNWPTTYFAPTLTGKGAFKDVYSVMNNWGANHGAISYGHIGSNLITMASMLRIPVSMHNIDEERIFRPKAWASFGTDNLESADYRACKTYGALYKK